MYAKMNAIAKGMDGMTIRVYEPSVMRVISYLSQKKFTYDEDIESVSKSPVYKPVLNMGGSRKQRTKMASTTRRQKGGAVKDNRNLLRQANAEQIKEGRQIYRLIQNLPSLRNLIGSIVKEQNTPFRYIFVLVSSPSKEKERTTKEKTKLLALVSATKKEGSTAIIDTVVPVKTDISDDTLKQMIAYSMLKMLWINNKGEISGTSSTSKQCAWTGKVALRNEAKGVAKVTVKETCGSTSIELSGLVTFKAGSNKSIARVTVVNSSGTKVLLLELTKS
jgi:hypothetical protein